MQALMFGACESAPNRAATAIERNARIQSQLIEDLLDMGRIVAGKLCPSVQP